MRRLYSLLAVVSVLFAGFVPGLSPRGTSGVHVAEASSKTTCKYVIKRIHRKKKRVRVCSVAKRTATPVRRAPATATPTPTRTPKPAGTSMPGGAVRAGGVNVSPAYRPWRYAAGPEPDSWWCKQPNCYPNADPLTRINTELRLAKQLNVANVRVEFPWAFIEPQNGVFDWTRADAIVHAANQVGVQIEPILIWTPGWAAAAPDAAPTASQFGDFVSAIVSRYETSVHYWELWNEPDDASKYWASGVASYTQTILIPGYKAVHAADSTAKIILGGAASADVNWFNGIYDNGGGNSFDILSFHDYGGGGGIPGDAAAVHDVLVHHGQGSKPIWLGEYGLQENSVQDTQQQDLIRVVLTSSMPVAEAQWYALRDTYAIGCCPPSVAATGFWGLIAHDDATTKDGYSLMQRLLGG